MCDAEAKAAVLNDLQCFGTIRTKGKPYPTGESFFFLIRDYFHTMTLTVFAGV